MHRSEGERERDRKSSTRCCLHCLHVNEASAMTFSRVAVCGTTRWKMKGERALLTPMQPCRCEHELLIRLFLINCVPSLCLSATVSSDV